MAHVDYSYYTTDYFGDILTENDFNKYEKKAEVMLNQYTFNRIKEDMQISDNIKYCLCRLMDIIFENDKKNKLYNSNYASETTAEYSVTYNKKSEIKNDFKLDIKEAINMLSNTDDGWLLYRGNVYVH